MKPVLFIGILLAVTLSTCCISTEPTNLTYADGYARNVWIEVNGKGMCSGVIIKTGTILTAGHCNGEVTVDGKPAKVVRVSKKYDLLLIAAPTESFAPVVFNTDAHVTDTVFSFANNDAYKSLYTIGRIIWQDNDQIFSSTLAAPGISGAALYDTYGRLVGISTQLHGTTLNNGGTVVTFSSAIPAKHVQEFLGES